MQSVNQETVSLAGQQEIWHAQAQTLQQPTSFRVNVASLVNETPMTLLHQPLEDPVESPIWLTGKRGHPDGETPWAEKSDAAHHVICSIQKDIVGHRYF